MAEMKRLSPQNKNSNISAEPSASSINRHKPNKLLAGTKKQAPVYPAPVRT